MGIVQKENWKNLTGTDRYQVSDLGKIRSLAYGKKRIMKTSINSKGYRTISLSGIRGNDKRTHYKVSSLVAEAFLGHTPGDGHKVVIDHRDEDKTNDRLSNLQLITSKHNTIRSIETRNTSSKYLYIYRHKVSGKWRVSLRCNGKGKRCINGSYESEEEAKRALDKYLKNLRNG